MTIDTTVNSVGRQHVRYLAYMQDWIEKGATRRTPDGTIGAHLDDRSIISVQISGSLDLCR